MSEENFWQSYQWNYNDSLFVPTTHLTPTRRTAYKNVLQETTGTAVHMRKYLGVLFLQKNFWS